MSDLSIQAWSAVWQIPTSRGLVVLKQTAPGQTADIAIHGFAVAVAPDYVDTPLSCDLRKGRMLLPGGVPTLLDAQHDRPEVVAGAVIDYALFQQATIGHAALAASTGVSVWDPGEAAREAEWQAHTLHAMPTTDLRHITAGQRDALLARRPAFRGAGRVLNASSIPWCLDHGDLWPGNVLLPSTRGHHRFIDFGDAAWTHPFLSVMPLLHYCHQQWAPPGAPFDIEHADLQHVRHAYLQRWADHASPHQLEVAFVAASQLAPLRRSKAAIINFHHAGPEAEHDLGPTPWAWLNSMYPDD